MNMSQAENLAHRVVSDMGGAFTMALAYVGDRLGIYKAMQGAGPMTSEELASKTGLNERYVREWLKAMVSAEYIDYNPLTRKFVMTEEQAFVLAEENSPMFCGGGFQFTTPSLYNTPRILEAFRDGGGVSYEQIGEEIPCAIERFFRPGYVNFLASHWIPAVPGLVERLTEGARVADIGCGRGQSTVNMAKAFPRSIFVGVDYHEGSIQAARDLAGREGVDNVAFVQAPAEQTPNGRPYDLVTTFDCIHDMVDPDAAIGRIKQVMSDDGVWLWSEPNASHEPHENRNPVGRVFQSVSPMHCMTVSLAHGGAGLGTVIGEKGARELAQRAGFGRFQRLEIDNPFNQFFAVRK